MRDDSLKIAAKPGGRVRMIDVARQAGVSRAAVSYVLNGCHEANGIAEETAQRIRRIAAELHFHPNHAAQQLTGKRSGVIGIIATDWLQLMQFRVLSWLSRLAESRGFHVLAWQTESKEEPLERYVREYSSRGVDGVVFLAFENDPFWPKAASLLAGIPRVVSVLDNPGIPGASCVESDVGDGVRQAVAHFHASGRRKIVQVLENVDSRMNRRRWQAFEEIHRELGRPIEPDMLCVSAPGWKDEDVPKYDALCAELIERGADAILATDDPVAAALMRFLQRRGLRVPEDVAVIGWSNDNMAPWLSPPLTSVSYLLDDIMGTAVDMLADMVAQPESTQSRHVLVKPKLYVRESS